ncbi:MAG: hypothetical protein WBM02_06135 [bacterium]
MNPLHSVDILVISALTQEIKGSVRFFNSQAKEIETGRQTKNYWETTMKGAVIGFRVCGVGKKRAVKDFASSLKQVRPNQILVIGFSGSLSTDLSIGDIAIIESTQYNGSTLAFNSDLTQKVKLALKEARISFNSGKSVTVDSVIDTAKAKNHLHSISQADCVDMESHHLASLADTYHIPIAMIRVISDYADETIGMDFNAIPRGKWASRRYFLSRPRLWIPLMKLRFDIAKAASRLTTATRYALTSLLNKPER